MAEAEAVVRPILEAVRKRGDRALLEYARKFDGLTRKIGAGAGAELQRRAQADAGVSRGRRDGGREHPRVCRAADAARVDREIAAGLRLGQIVRPLDTVAAYIPAGRYPLPSTLLMTVVPAQVAGVPNICVASPEAGAGGLRHGARCWACSNVFQMGGAQAIAAFAFGTRTVPRADRIVGPGNIYVAAAKKLLAGEVGIDFVAGPDRDPDHRGRWRSARTSRRTCWRRRSTMWTRRPILLTTSKRLAAAVAKRSRAAAGDAADRGGGAEVDRARIRRSCWCGRWTRRWRFRTASRRST